MKTIIQRIRENKFLRFVLFSSSISLINVQIFQALLRLGVEYKVANITAIMVAKTLVYVASKILVFKTKTNFKETMLEIFRFAWTRSFSIALDYFGVILAVELLHADPIISKYIILAFAIILNYYIGKKLVFHKGSKTERETQ